MSGFPNPPAGASPANGSDYPVEHARPGLSTAFSVLAILTVVPLALIAQADRMSPLLPAVIRDLGLLPADAGAVTRAVGSAGVLLCLAAPVAAWLSRLLPPWVVLLGGLLVTAAAYLASKRVGSLAMLAVTRDLHGLGAGLLLASSAALVGTASARLRPLLAAAWAAALVGTLALLPRLSRSAADAGTALWRSQLRPYPWLLAVAAGFVIALAAASLADRRPRLYPRRIDLAALLPLVPGLAGAALLRWPPDADGWTAVLALIVLALSLVGLAVVAALLVRPSGDDRPWAADGRGAVGSATASVAFVAGVVVAATVRGVLYLGLPADPEAGSRPLPASTTGMLVGVAVAGVLAAILGALMPDIRRRAVIVVGLLVAAAGALSLVPATAAIWANTPGLAVLAGGVGLALGSVLRAVGPLATVVAGGVVGVGLPVSGLASAAMLGWQASSPEVALRLWLVTVVIVLLAAATIAAGTLAISTRRATRPGAAGPVPG
ncbi:MAG: hypothetical protein HY241_16845 [Actinobacteria bacterium]|nr:hypothetical protein [Actinomycetota bacterium]